MKKTLYVIILGLSISFIFSGCKASKKDDSYHGLSQVWSEKTNDSDRFGLDMQLNNDGTYYFGEVYDDSGKIIQISAGTWESDDNYLTFTPDEKISALDVDDNDKYKTEYTYDKHDNSLKLNMTMTDGENTYPEDILLYGDGKEKESDDVQKAGLLHNWASDNYIQSVVLTQDIDDNYTIKIGTYDTTGMLSEISGNVTEFTENDFTMLPEDESHHYAVTYNVDGNSCIFNVDGTEFKTSIN